VAIVATALPAIGAALDFPPAQLAWIITAYTVVLAGMLILGGRIADLAGARRMFQVGMVEFIIASLGCALAWNPTVLVGARIVQGGGAALLSPAALAAVNQLVVRPEARRRALGWWTAAAAGGGASGWVCGGALVEFAGWRWVFAINAPVGIATLLFGRRALAGLPGRARRTPREGLDLLGAVTVTVGIALATLGFSWLAEHPARWLGWAALGAALGLLTWFVVQERRARQPMLPPHFLRIPGVLGGNLGAIALTASTTPAMLTVVLYVQDTLRLAPARGSLLFPAFNVAVVAGSLLGPRLLTKFAARPALAGGFAGIVAGTLVLYALPIRGVPVTVLLIAFALLGTGLGTASVASTTAGTMAVPSSEQGVASGLLNSCAQLGTALGLAVTTPLVAAAAPMTGYRLGFTIALLIGVAGATSGLALPRRLPQHEPDATPSTSSKSAAPRVAETG
jgi:MFS family permease